ncbi:MAG: class I SAM-dependent methyltransferase [Patescibacteria group bacterium]|nr:class I SAM-dependent methyltransferase [Patescibacteria group bacterium]MDD5490493.1 class I SAM-dependent methyltransferase [Patescibacteria group bacterium]
METNSYNNKDATRYYIKDRQRFGWRNRGERVVKFTPIKEGWTVLDLCCGPGFTAKVIREQIGKEGEIVGIDNSKLFIKYARKFCSFKNAKFKHGDVQSLNKLIGIRKFDVVLLLASWLWIKNKKALLKKIERALGPDGRFVLSLTSDNLLHKKTRKFYWQFRKNLKEAIENQYPDINHRYLDDLPNLNAKYLKEAISLIKKAGFNHLNIYEVKRNFTKNDKLFTYKNSARTEWLRGLLPKDRFKIIKKALIKTFSDLKLSAIQRHTYYIVFKKIKAKKA